MALVCALTAMLVAAPAQAAPIPAPKQYFGFELGTTGKLARFSKIQSYLKLIGDNSNRADYFNLGTTTNGNEMPLLHVSSPANLAKVDQILAANDRLANPRGLSEEDAKELAANHIPVYYLEAGMHSTEVGPVQVIPNIVHRLATERSPEINRILNEMLIIVLPAANPDGSHLVTDFFNETAGTSMTRTYPDLYHHYTGHDDNRDWLFFTQLESKLRIGVFKKYKPVVEHILHQAGATSPRMWVPPYNDGVSATRDAITMQSTNALGMDVARGLWAEDKKGVKFGDSYGIMATADIPSFHTFQGAAMFLFEAASLHEPRVPVHEHERPAARRLAEVDAQPAAVRQDHVDARADARLPGDRHVPRAQRGREGAGALVAGQPVPRPAQRHRLHRGPVRVRAAGEPAGPVRRLRHAQGARAVAGGDPPREGRVHRRRQDVPGRLVRGQHAPAAGQVGRADHGQPALSGGQELRARARC